MREPCGVELLLLLLYLCAQFDWLSPVNWGSHQHLSCSYF